MLQISKLTFTHKRDLRTILSDFNMVLNYGDKAVIIGEEGNGKSTLLKWIYNPEMIEEYIEAEGNRYLGKERLSYLPQELEQENRGKTLYEFFSSKAGFFDISPKELASLSRKFQLDEGFFYSEQKMDSLSGGERIKAQLMAALMEQPTVLLLDEPSNDIDIDTLELLEKMINDFPYIVLFISHDEVLIENTANMIIHIEQIQRKTKSRYKVTHCSYTEYVKNRQDLFKHQEQLAQNDRRAKAIRDEKYRKVYESVAKNLSSCSRQAPSVAKNLKDKMHTVKAMEKRFERENAEMTEMPEQEEAIFFKLGNKEAAIPNGKTVLEYSLDELRTPDNEKVLAKNIFLRIRGAEKVCIIGKNGCGKTTLLEKIAESMLQRDDIKVEYMPQTYENLLDIDATPIDFLDTTGEKADRTRIRTYLGSLKYTADEMEHPIGKLSGGQKAKVLLLKMSLSKANVLILDEPTRNFSPLSGPVIRKMIAGFPGAVISISHDRKYIDEVSTVVYKLGESGLTVIADT
jgi:ATPase subunit of ABC transporter with duplicated ATPase domains